MRKVLARVHNFARFLSRCVYLTTSVQDLWDAYRSTGFRRVVKFFCLISMDILFYARSINFCVDDVQIQGKSCQSFECGAYTQSLCGVHPNDDVT
jgi:hypothetical protein